MNYSNSEVGSAHKSKGKSNYKSSEQPIEPYVKPKKNNEEMESLVYRLQEENKELKYQLENRPQPAMRGSYNEEIGNRKVPENDGTVVIGGMSNMALNTTDKDVSVKGKIDMSPIETKERDISAADEQLLGVFDPVGSTRSKRRLNFDENQYIEKENINASPPELDNLRSNKDSIYKSNEGLIQDLKSQIDEKSKIIEQLTSKLNYYSKSSKDYSSPRFVDPDHIRREKSYEHMSFIDNILRQEAKNLGETENLYGLFIRKFKNSIPNINYSQENFERISQFENDHMLRQPKTEDISAGLKTVNSL